MCSKWPPLASTQALRAGAPLLDGLVNNTLVKFIPYSLDMLAQLINIVDLHLVHLLLKYRPDFIINQIQIQTITRPECSRDESWCFSPRSLFSRSVMVLVSVSVLGVTRLHFVNSGVKITGKYYRETLLKEEMLPGMCDISKYCIFQQDSAPAHPAKEAVDLLSTETPAFIPPTLWPLNSLDLSTNFKD